MLPAPCLTEYNGMLQIMSCSSPYFSPPIILLQINLGLIYKRFALQSSFRCFQVKSNIHLCIYIPERMKVS